MLEEVQSVDVSHAAYMSDFTLEHSPYSCLEIIEQRTVADWIPTYLPA